VPPTATPTNTPTPVPPTADSASPTTPTNVKGTIQKQGWSKYVQLSWNASTDNVGVVGYKILRGTSSTNLTQIGTSTSTTYKDSTNLKYNTKYYYSVVAYDAAGNNSQASSVYSILFK
jgi:fibronectin type 3 domain-containing protein